MKCDRFVGTGVSSSKCIKEELATTVSSSRTSSRCHSSKQNKLAVHHTEGQRLTRSNTGDFSHRALVKGIPVSLKINNTDVSSEIFIVKTEPKDCHNNLEPMTCNGVIIYSTSVLRLYININIKTSFVHVEISKSFFFNFRR